MKQEIYLGISLEDVKKFEKRKNVEINVNSFDEIDYIYAKKVNTAFTSIPSDVKIIYSNNNPQSIIIYDPFDSKVFTMKINSYNHFDEARYQKFEILFDGDCDFHSTDLSNMKLTYDYPGYEYINRKNIYNLDQAYSEIADVLRFTKKLDDDAVEEVVSDIKRKYVRNFELLKMVNDSCCIEKMKVFLENNYNESDDFSRIKEEMLNGKINVIRYFGNYSIRLIVTDKEL